jgi:predicted RND superfamily exporter protein
VHNRVEEELAVGSADDPFGTTARWLGPPLVVAVVAAVIAFVSMQVSEVPMVRDFGVMLAVGIVLLLVAGVVITIAVLGGRERRRPSPRHDFGDAPTERAVAWLGSLPQVTVIPLVIAAVALFGFGLVAEDAFEIESDPRRWVDQDSAVIADLETLESETGSTSELGVYIQADDVLTQPMVDFATQLGVDGLAESNGRLITASSIYMTTYLLTDVPGAAPVIPSAENVVATLAQAPPDIAKSVIADDGGAANLIFRSPTSRPLSTASKALWSPISHPRREPAPLRLVSPWSVWVCSKMSRPTGRCSPTWRSVWSPCGYSSATGAWPACSSLWSR